MFNEEVNRLVIKHEAVVKDFERVDEVFLKLKKRIFEQE